MKLLRAAECPKWVKLSSQDGLARRGGLAKRNPPSCFDAAL